MLFLIDGPPPPCSHRNGRHGAVRPRAGYISPVPLVVTLALRNLMRHPRRTALTLSALVLGIGLMVLGRAWTDAMERAVVVPAKDGTLGHVQVYAKDAAADEGGHLSFVMPQNNYRMIPDPRALIARVVAAEPRLSAGLSRSEE